MSTTRILSAYEPASVLSFFEDICAIPHVSGDERAIAETDRKYRGYLHTVAWNIVKDEQDCEECLNDTYLKTWNSIPPQRPNCLKAFLTKITRTIAIDRYRRERRQKRVPSECTLSLAELNEATGEGITAFDGEYLLDGITSAMLEPYETVVTLTNTGKPMTVKWCELVLMGAEGELLRVPAKNDMDVTNFVEDVNRRNGR